MAFKEKLPSGRYRGGYWTKIDGKRKKIWLPGTYRLLSEALNAAAEEEVKARRRANTASTLPASITWDEWWDIVADGREFESDTAEKERSIVKIYLRPQWGQRPLNEISRKRIQDWIDDLERRRKPGGGRYSPAYIGRIYRAFTMTINKAVKEGVLGASPLVEIRLPKVPKRQKTYLTLDEAGQYGTALRTPDKRGALADYADAIDFGMETGLRPSELIGVHVDQLNRATRRLTVRTVYVKKQKKMRDYPKDLDEREIPLTTRAMEIWDRHTAGRDLTTGCGIEHFDGHACTSELVFRTARGKPLNHDALWHAMQVAAAEAGVPGRSPYDWRRGFATRLREAGVDPATQMELLGHEKFEQTHGYTQQPADFDVRVRAALDDPAATRLRAVGPRGTQRGTGAAEVASSNTGRRGRRRTS